MSHMSQQTIIGCLQIASQTHNLIKWDRHDTNRHIPASGINPWKQSKFYWKKQRHWNFWTGRVVCVCICDFFSPLSKKAWDFWAKLEICCWKKVSHCLMPNNIDFQCKLSLWFEIIRLKVVLGKQGSIMQLFKYRWPCWINL